MEHLGVEVEISEDMPADQLLQGLADGSVHMGLIGYYVAYPNPDEVLRGLFHSQSSTNYFHWHNQEFDALLDQAISGPNWQQQLALYHQAEKLAIAEETAVVPLYYLQAYGLMRPGFQMADSGRIVRDSAMKFKNIRVI
jgi:oligopeptide transport system substrate-binding protein